MSQKRNLLTGGLALTLHNWPALVWTYVFNIGFALLFSLPLRSQLAAITEHSLASQRLGTAFDLGVLFDVLSKLGEGPGSAASASYFATWFYLAVYFLIVPGTLAVYQTATPAKLSTLLQTGLVYFWRFVRITLVSFLVFGIILGPLLFFQNLWSNHVDEHILGRPGAMADFAGFVIIGLFAAFLRVYFDLVEVYTVQLGLTPPVEDSNAQAKLHRKIRKVLIPALKMLFRNFFRTYVTFAFLTLLGMSSVIITARIALHSLAQPRVWPIFLLGQIGLFLMLLTRFWQRGAETILALDNPLPAPPVVVLVPVIPEPIEPEIVILEPAVPLEE